MNDICSCKADEAAMHEPSDCCLAVGCDLGEAALMKDVCECSTTDADGSSDYCCTAQDSGDYCCGQDGIGDAA